MPGDQGKGGSGRGRAPERRAHNQAGRRPDRGRGEWGGVPPAAGGGIAGQGAFHARSSWVGIAALLAYQSAIPCQQSRFVLSFNGKKGRWAMKLFWVLLPLWLLLVVLMGCNLSQSNRTGNNEFNSGKGTGKAVKAVPVVPFRDAVGYSPYANWGWPSVPRPPICYRGRTCISASSLP